MESGAETDAGWHFYADPREVLERISQLLASEPLQYTMFSSWARRESARLDAGLPQDDAGNQAPYWYAVHYQDGRPDGAAMRTHPAAPHPLWLPGLNEQQAHALADALLARGEGAGPFGVNGMLPSARIVADHIAAATGREVHEHVRTRLFSLVDLRLPREPEGTHRYATTDDLDLIVDWLNRFARDADEQAGRPAGHLPTGVLSGEEIRRRILDGYYRLWEVDGEVVHLTGTTAVQDGLAGIGPVYTPAEHRGHGYAGWVVALRSEEIQRAGATAYLFTDQDNPVSNRLYESLGYRMVADSVELALG